MAQDTGSGAFFLKNQAKRDGEEIFVSAESRLLEDGLEPLVLERLDPGSCQGKRQEAAQIAVERARERVGLEQPDDFLDDRAQVLLLDEQPPLEAVEEQERITDVSQWLDSAVRQPGEVVGTLVRAELGIGGIICQSAPRVALNGLPDRRGSGRCRRLRLPAAFPPRA